MSDDDFFLNALAEAPPWAWFLLAMCIAAVLSFGPEQVTP